MGGGRFEIKCPSCRKTVGRTDNVIESVQGANCKECKTKFAKLSSGNVSRGTLRGL